MCRLSARYARVATRSRVVDVRWWRAWSGVGEGWGRDCKVRARAGRRSSMRDGGGGGEMGERRVEVRVVRSRVWWARWVDSAVLAVVRLW